MKNLALSGAILIIVIVGIFLVAKGDGNSNDTIIPSPVPIGSPKVDLLMNQEATNPNSKKTYSNPPAVLSADEIKGKKINISTSKGNIIFELFEDAPISASNFIFLVNEKFYDELTFHRREEGFVIQGGDPNGDGTGGPGYRFQDETVTRDYERGIVAMANSGPNTNGSQFFVMLQDAQLPKQYTIFGRVVEGMDVVDKIEVGDVMDSVTVE